MLLETQHKTLHHLSLLLSQLHQSKDPEPDPITISGNIKRNHPHTHDAQDEHSQHNHQHQHKKKEQKNRTNNNIKNVSNSWEWRQKWRNDDTASGTIVRNFQMESEKLEWCGVSFGAINASLIQICLRDIARKEKLVEVRFWGVIRGTHKDYYVIQGRKEPYKSIGQLSTGAQKNGQGVNYYTYWVTNNLQQHKWTQLPEILPIHIQTARKIKLMFTGNLEQSIYSYPQFPGKQKHYLKAQLSRITHAVELAPKGIFKPDDNNPKIIEYEEEVKIPDFAELNSLEGWIHKNQMILNLGRCSHFVDPKLPEEEIEAKMTELTEKDPQMERLKGINQDKVPEELGLGLENPWIVKVVGNSQVFTKDDANLVYGVIMLKNIYWPGWVTIGYKNGYSNIYIGNGLKSTQSSLNIYQNPDLQKDAEDVNEYPEPYPKELPKQQPAAEGEAKPEDE